MTSPSVGKILEHFRIYGAAIPFYSPGDSRPSVEMNDNVSSWEDGWTGFTRKCRVSQRNIFRTLAEDT